MSFFVIVPTGTVLLFIWVIGIIPWVVKVMKISSACRSCFLVIVVSFVLMLLLSASAIISCLVIPLRIPVFGVIRVLLRTMKRFEKDPSVASWLWLMRIASVAFCFRAFWFARTLGR